MKLLLIRHAEPDYAIDSLTEKGFREASLLSDRLYRLKNRRFLRFPSGACAGHRAGDAEAAGPRRANAGLAA